MLLAIAKTGDIHVASDPNNMIRIANSYALAGLPRLIGMLESRQNDTALDFLSDELEAILKK
jgi:hypothetical protein